MKTLKKFLYEVQKEKDSSKDITSKFNDRKNILNLKIVVIVDVSGSISNDQYKSFMQALDKIKGLSMIKVIETDTMVTSMYDFEKNRKGKIFSFNGGGGTNFLEAYTAAKKMNADCWVWFTDGDDSKNLTNPNIPNAAVVTKGGYSPYDWMTECSRVDK